MPLTFPDLPVETRLQIYDNLLVIPGFIHLCPCARWGEERPCRADTGEPLDLCPAILCTARSICDEAAPLLYSRNAFIITALDPWALGHVDVGVVKGFLDLIGPRNAAYIRHVSIAFPGYSNYTPGQMALEGYSERIIGFLREKCTGLVDLETEAGNFNMLEALLGRKGPELAGEAVRAVDALFRSIPSLETVVANMFPELSPACSVTRDKMRECGWVIRPVPRDQMAFRHGHMPDEDEDDDSEDDEENSEDGDGEDDGESALGEERSLEPGLGQRDSTLVYRIDSAN